MKLETRRQVLQRGGGLVGFLFGLGYTQDPNTDQIKKARQQTLPHPEAPFAANNGQLVSIDKILNQKIPENYLENIFKLMKNQTGVLVSKKYHQFFLFEKGSLVHRGVAMHANPNFSMKNRLGHAYTPNSNPTKPYVINRIYGRNYTSNESRDTAGQREKMYYPMFYDFNGRAIHGIETSISKTGEEQIAYNNSHGCINTTINDAAYIQRTFFPDGKMKRGQATPIVVIID